MTSLRCAFKTLQFSVSVAFCFQSCLRLMKWSSVGFKSSYWLCLLGIFHHLLTYKYRNMSKQERADIWWVRSTWHLTWYDLFSWNFAKQKQTKSIAVQRNEASLFSWKRRRFALRGTKKSISGQSDGLDWQTHSQLIQWCTHGTHDVAPFRKDIFRDLLGSEFSLLSCFYMAMILKWGADVHGWILSIFFSLPLSVTS